MQWIPNLEPNSTVPLYRQLYEYVVGLLHSGKLAPGDRLPATRELAGTIGLNRATVSAAYELLESEGLISQHVGRGTFVTAAPAGARGPDWSALLRESGGLTFAPASGAVPMSFAASRPDERLFPLEDFRASCEEVLAGSGLASLLQFGPPGGYEGLRQRLRERAASEGVALPEDDVVITNGCQQSLDLIARLLVRQGDCVAIEDPVYPGLKNVFLHAGARLVGIPMGPGGMDTEALAAAVARERIKLVVVSSRFQNPTGATVAAARRPELLRIAEAAGCVVVENDIYGELRYHGEAVAALKQMDGNVVLVRSFSKSAFPGLRVGWVCAPRAVAAALARMKQLADLHTDQFSQAVLLRFIDSGRFERHVRAVVEAGSARLAAALAACQKHLPPAARWSHPQGGMNLWLELPEQLDAGELLPRAEREGVSYMPGKYFAVTRPAASALRLSFAALEPAEIRRGIEILGEIFSRELERVERARGGQPAPAMV